MKKKFNTTGVCIPKKHYMVNIDNKLEQILELINNGDYFIINRPRQYGKTTTMHLLEQKLKDKYLVISTSFEGIGDKIFSDEEIFSREILDIFADSLEFIDEEKFKELKELGKTLSNLKEVSKALTKFIKNNDKEVILFIDEVDKSSNNQLFMSFLGMLRNKYLSAAIGKDYTFKSIILAGVHDIKNLKIKIRDNEETKYNSPWNIAVNFDVDMSFSNKEIQTMLEEYSIQEQVSVNLEEISEKIYFYTSGYPYLVSKICEIMNKNFPNEWNLYNLDKCVKILLNEKNTLFDSLIKNLENNIEFKEFIEKIILLGQEIVYIPSDPLISMGEMYGFFRRVDNVCKIHNRIFEQYIYNHMASIKSRENNNISIYNFRDNFITKDNGLDFEKVLIKFQEFMKKEYSTLDSKFIEREGRLLFLAFIKPIINGVGFDFKEVVISEEKRLDVVITYNQHKYVVELKIWYGEEYHKKGIEQLVQYLELQGIDKGYLLIYNFNKGKRYKSDVIRVSNKEIFMVFV